jgi:hypothetical protein
MCDLYSEALKPGYVLGTVTRLWSVPGGDEIFLFAEMYRLFLRPTQPTVQWVWGALSTGF